MGDYMKRRVRFASIPSIPENCLWAYFINEGSTVIDRSGNGHTGAVTDVVYNEYSEPVFNNSTSIIDLTTTNFALCPSNYTIEAYFCPLNVGQAINEYEHVVSHKLDLGYPSSNGSGIAIKKINVSNCAVYFNIGSSWWGEIFKYENWLYAVVTKGLDGYYLYVNGVLEYGPLVVTESWPDVTYKIGKQFGGLIQWTAMYEETWTEQQILDRYNNSFKSDGKLKKCGWNIKNNIKYYHNGWQKANTIKVYKDGNWI